MLLYNNFDFLKRRQLELDVLCDVRVIYDETDERMQQRGVSVLLQVLNAMGLAPAKRVGQLLNDVSPTPIIVLQELVKHHSTAAPLSWQVQGLSPMLTDRESVSTNKIE